MSVSYSITSTEGVETIHRNAACYAQHYGQLRNYTSLNVYVDKKWMLEKRADNNIYYKEPRAAFTIEDYKEYVRLLKLMGMKLSMVEEDKQFVFNVPLDKQKCMANKLVLNCIRYLCEDPYPSIVKHFLHLCKDECGSVSTFTKLLLAHQCFMMYHGGHTFIPGMYIPLPLSNKQLKEIIIDNDENKTVTSVLPVTNKIFNERTVDKVEGNKYYSGWKYIDHRDPIFKLFKQGATVKEIYKQYKTLCKHLT